MSHAEIRDAVAAARSKLPRLAIDYAERAIAADETVDRVRSDLLAMMCSAPMGRASMLSEARRAGLLPAEKPEAADKQVSDPRAKSLENMRAQVRRAGMVPK